MFASFDETFIAVSSRDKTATAGEDYTTLAGTASFAATDVMATVTLSISQDMDCEGIEQLEVYMGSISGTGNNVVGELDKAIVNIVDDDTPSEYFVKYFQSLLFHNTCLI